MTAEYPGADAIQVPAQGQFSRALALDMGTRMCANNDLVGALQTSSLLYFNRLFATLIDQKLVVHHEYSYTLVKEETLRFELKVTSSI